MARDNNILGKAFYFVKKANNVDKSALEIKHFPCAHFEKAGKIKKSRLFLDIFVL